MAKKTSRREFVKTGLAAGLGSAGLHAAVQAFGQSPAGKRRPNVLFIMSDQQSCRAMSACGNRWLKTPHMDSIAAHGVLFKNSYCTTPVCGPSRSTLITGRMPHETGVEINGQTPRPSIPNMGQVFRDAGYETAWAGKWHLPASYLQGPRATIPGFEYLPCPEGTKYRLGAETDGPVADQAIEYLRRKHEKPFLLGVSLHNPHDICWWVREEPAKHADLETFPPLPDNFEIDPNEPEFISICRRRTEYGPEIQWTLDWDHDQWRAYLHAYYRLTEQVDREIGRVLAAVRDAGLEDDTLIVFTSDHGEGMAGHHWVVKLMLYEEPVTVPLVVSWKGVTPAGVVDDVHLASGLNVLPTICDYAGVPAPPMTGTSLKPIIDDPGRRGQEYVVAELASDRNNLEMKGRMLRTGRYKYVVFAVGRNPEMLFDLKADPGETRNLARDPAAADVLQRHRTLLGEWIARTKDDFKLSR